jgi:hypothetical protein
MSREWARCPLAFPASNTQMAAASLILTAAARPEVRDGFAARTRQP